MTVSAWSTTTPSSSAYSTVTRSRTRNFLTVFKINFLLLLSPVFILFFKSKLIYPTECQRTVVNNYTGKHFSQISSRKRKISPSRFCLFTLAQELFNQKRVVNLVALSLCFTNQKNPPSVIVDNII